MTIHKLQQTPMANRYCNDIYSLALQYAGHEPKVIYRQLLEASWHEDVFRPTELQALKNLLFGKPRDEDPVIQKLRAGQLVLCQCPTCRNPLLPATTEYFYRDIRKRNGLYSWCKDCHRHYMRVTRGRVM